MFFNVGCLSGRVSLRTSTSPSFLFRFRFGSIAILLSSLGFAVESFLDDVEDPAHTDGTEEVLEGDEGVSDAEEEGGELEVDEEDDNSEIHESVGGRDQVGLLVHNKDESRQETRLGGEVRDEELHRCGCPDSPAKSLSV